ncbi:capsule polysaccharide biosynthesis protein [Durotheca rogersii]|uniref:capsule polysaccharide biosynthesis protein n=1 Tax=Durotheca rogersii TaxID=419775 RepID=UPI0022209534|nr:capsule polysaccharide biosynthesis protein [Durotheca rogersii]KAI5852042.1 capsule polysaccharide biosynthesis protein [Durotheca rogersii]
MASSIGATSQALRVAASALLPALVYGAYKGNAWGSLEPFFTGPGRTSRIVALVVILVNWKSFPLTWTFRVWSAMISHFAFRSYNTHTPDKLFHPVITTSHVTLLEVDYNVHKSNSTYFADLDVGRTHLVCHLLARGSRAVANNATTKLVLDPADPSRPAKGRFNIMLGAVECSFKKELLPYQKFEMWTRILSWDRKWLYVVTHFVEKGAVQPRSWDSGNFGPTRKSEGQPEDWEKKVHATAVSKYVFKIGRLTVHPAIIIEASGLLPARPGGWISAEDGAALPVVHANGNAETNGDTALNGNGTHANEVAWDWKKTEEIRRKGYEFAAQFAALDELQTRFDGGEDGALGQFGIF